MILNQALNRIIKKIVCIVKVLKDIPYDMNQTNSFQTLRG